MVQVPPESDSEIRVQEQWFIWELIPGRFIWEWEREAAKGRKPIKDVLSKQFPLEATGI